MSKAVQNTRIIISKCFLWERWHYFATKTAPFCLFRPGEIIVAN